LYTVNLIRAALVIRRPCTDFMDMLQRLINSHIIIIITVIAVLMPKVRGGFNARFCTSNMQLV